MLHSQQPSIPCPVCSKEDISTIFETKDYSLTQEDFTIVECPHCTLRFTFPIPSKELIAPYYNFPEYISHTDVKKGWMNILYHKIRKHTLLQKTQWVQGLFTGHKGNLLEIGAGTGAFADAMIQKGWSVTALEPDESSRLRAFDNYGIDLLPIDELYNLPSKKFEIISLWHVLEHVHDLKPYLAAFERLLKPNGRLIIAVPNYTSYDASFYKNFWAAYDVPRHLYHFSPVSMKQLLAPYHFSIVQTKPMWFDSFYVSLLSEKYKKTGIIGVLRAFFIGCLSNIYAIKNHQKASSIIYEIKSQGL